eukprot:scaffold105545_cov45-Phaeocystis_antarctica.AAC.2
MLRGVVQPARCRLLAAVLGACGRDQRRARRAAVPRARTRRRVLEAGAGTWRLPGRLAMKYLVARLPLMARSPLAMVRITGAVQIPPRQPHRRKPLRRHRHPRVPARSQLVIRQVQQPAADARTIPHDLLPLHMPAHPSKREPTVHHVPQRSRYGVPIPLSTHKQLVGAQPAHKRTSQLAIHEDVQAAPNELKRVHSLLCHRNPRVPAN